MRISSVNFKSGFIYKGGRYINPDVIKEISPFTDEDGKKGTFVKYIDGAIEKNMMPVNIFVAAANQAKNSDDIVDVSNNEIE